MKNNTKFNWLIGLALVCGFVLGFFCRNFFPASTTDVVQTGKAELAISYHNSNVDMVLTHPIAPDYYVGYGIVGSHGTFTDDPEWDPLGIGPDRAMELARRIRKVDGVTEDVYAKGYELTFRIADSHLGRRDEIVEEVKAIVQDFEDNRFATDGR